MTTPNDIAAELVWRNKLSLRRQRQAWRTFAGAALIFGAIYTVVTWPWLRGWLRGGR